MEERVGASSQLNMKQDYLLLVIRHEREDLNLMARYTRSFVELTSKCLSGCSDKVYRGVDDHPSIATHLVCEFRLCCVLVVGERYDQSLKETQVERYYIYRNVSVSLIGSQQTRSVSPVALILSDSIVPNPRDPHSDG